MNSVVSLKDWKQEHPDRVIVSLLYGRTVVNITSEDYRTTYVSCVSRYSHTQKAFDEIIDTFLNKYPSAKIVRIIVHDEDDA